MTCMAEDGDYYEELRGVELVGRAEIVEEPERMWSLGVDLFERYYAPFTEELRPFVETMLNKRVVIKLQRGAGGVLGPPQARPALHPAGGLSPAGRSRRHRRGDTRVVPYQTMDDDEVWAFLDSTPPHTGKLATTRKDGAPARGPDLVRRRRPDASCSPPAPRPSRAAPSGATRGWRCASTTSGHPSPFVIVEGTAEIVR